MGQVANALPVAQLGQGYVQTLDVGGDRFGYWSASAFNPTAFLGTTTQVPIATLSIPPTYNQLQAGGVNAAAPSQSISNAIAHPFSPKSSIVPYVLVGLVVGWLGLHTLYYRKGRK